MRSSTLYSFKHIAHSGNISLVVAELAFASKHEIFGWRAKHVSFDASQKQQIKDVHYQECFAKIRVSTIVNNYQFGKKEKFIIESVKEVLEIITDQNAFCETGDLFSKE
jgi:short-subunit dehydrogenase